SWPHFHGIFLVVAAHVARRVGNRIAIFDQAGGDVDFAGEGQALHHHVVLAERVIEGKSRAVDFFDGQRRGGGGAGGGGGDGKCGGGGGGCFVFLVDGGFL